MLLKRPPVLAAGGPHTRTCKRRENLAPAILPIARRRIYKQRVRRSNRGGLHDFDVFADRARVSMPLSDARVAL